MVNEGNNDRQRLRLDIESNEEQDKHRTDTEKTGNNEELTVPMDHEVTLMNEDLVLTQTMNANEQQIVTIDPEVALLHEDLPPVQTMIQNDNDTLTLHIPDWYIVCTGGQIFMQ